MRSAMCKFKVVLPSEALDPAALWIQGQFTMHTSTPLWQPYSQLISGISDMILSIEKIL